MQQLSLIFLLLSVAFQQLNAQCSPPMAETCDEVNVLCSLDEVNGYACNNPSTIPSPCQPLCSQGGVGNNTSWWAFVTDGGNVTITMTIGACVSSQGLEFGIWGNCVCSEEVACHSNPCAPPASITTINATLVKCKIYYLWVDGCNGDICDFTLNTSGGGPPSLSPLGKINNKANMIIEPVCEGACNVLFFVNPQPGGCEPTYVWTLDGNEVGGNTNEVRLDMPDEGDFVMCVTAYIGNPQSGSICSQQGPQCATIKVRPIADKIGVRRTLCWEQAKGGFKWHSQRIFTSGIYSENFSDANCCKFDSIVEFEVLDPPHAEQVIFITCDNKPFIDVTGKKHFPCLHKSSIVLTKTTDGFNCDSSILLTAINVDFAPTWHIECFSGMVELIPNINIIKPCNAGETYQFEYKWFKNSDPSNIIGADERLLVQAVSQDYCLEVKVRTELDNEYEVCTKIFCENLNEGGSTPDCAFKLVGDKVFCFDPFALYNIDSFLPAKVNFYTWTVDGGQIVSKADSSVVEVKWSFNPNDSGKICVSFNTDCGTSCEKCLKVKFQTKIAGEDFEHRGLTAYLDAKSNPNGMWRLISGPYPVKIEDPTFARTKITAFNYGYYCFEWTVTTPNCTLKDTICVDLHSFKVASPEYPRLLFFERAKSSDDKDQSTEILFTPNLIENNGESFVIIDDAVNSKINYWWFDIYGRAITHKELNFESGIQRININSPIHEGMYFLVIEIDGVNSVRKVCVIE